MTLTNVKSRNTSGMKILKVLLRAKGNGLLAILLSSGKMVPDKGKQPLPEVDEDLPILLS